jgi:hypothetical protein
MMGPTLLTVLGLVIAVPPAEAPEPREALRQVQAHGASSDSGVAVPPSRSAPGDTVLIPMDELSRNLADPEGRALALERIRSRAAESNGPRATRWSQVLVMAEKGSAEAGGLAVQGVLDAEAGDPTGGARRILEGLDGVEPEDRPGLLFLASHLMEADEPEEAASLRRQLLELDPEASEAQEVRLALARHLARSREADHRDEARSLLEELVVMAPSHPLAPEARRLLSTLRDP